ncbi:MAG: hypothetical protein PHI90_04275 [Clostridia bacterium]|nr:hypothetical protein [Clostridia bacterium]
MPESLKEIGQAVHGICWDLKNFVSFYGYIIVITLMYMLTNEGKNIIINIYYANLIAFCILITIRGERHGTIDYK